MNLLVSLARTPKVNVPAVVGVPLRVPVLVRLIPAGSAPKAIPYSKGATPPLALIDVLYPVPTVAAGKVIGVMSMKGVAMVRV